MVRAITGVLVECDVAVAQILEALNKDLGFIIELLDDTHIFVDARKIDHALQQLEEILEQNTYRAADE
ncbi:TFIIH subunit TTDA/Tfb5 [Chytridium lagenaria]|nr:TFIIH subunit TTDA/Tfb5 [Chytridium lagenaria]